MLPCAGHKQGRSSLPGHPLVWLAAGLGLGWATHRWALRARASLVQWMWPMGPLRLARPLVTFDLESTGLNVARDRVLEIAAVKLLPDGSMVVKGPQRLNPRAPVSAEATAIHGITQADLEGCPSFADVAAEWQAFLEGCDLHGFNAKRFDVPLLRNEFRRAGIPNFPPLGGPVVDSFRLFCMQEPRTLAAAAAFYCGHSHGGAEAHTALADARVTLRVLLEQVRRYQALPRDVPGLAHESGRPMRAQDITGDGKFQWRGDTPVLGFGKHSGEPLAAVITRHRDFLRWMALQDFSDETLLVVEQALKGQLPTRAGGWQQLSFEQAPAAAAQPAQPRRAGGEASAAAAAPQQQRRPQRQQAAAGAGPGSSAPGGGGEPVQQAAGETVGAAAAAAACPADGADGHEPAVPALGVAAGEPPAQAASGWPELPGPASAEAAAGADSWGSSPPSPQASSGDNGWSLVGQQEAGAAAGAEPQDLGSSGPAEAPNPEPQAPLAEGEQQQQQRLGQDS